MLVMSAKLFKSPHFERVFRTVKSNKIGIKIVLMTGVTHAIASTIQSFDLLTRIKHDLV